MTIETTLFNDSQLLAGRYDPEEEELQISFFRSSDTYAYFGVPQEVWEDLSDADDPGDFFRQYVKGQYEYRRL